ncbi:hypothetical protein ACFE04_024537 [Oxalis oulophora]
MDEKDDCCYGLRLLAEAAYLLDDRYNYTTDDHDHDHDHDDDESAKDHDNNDDRGESSKLGLQLYLPKLLIPTRIRSKRKNPSFLRFKLPTTTTTTTTTLDNFQLRGGDVPKTCLKRLRVYQACDTKPKKQKRRRIDITRPTDESPELPLRFKNKIDQLKGFDVKLVIQKRLYKSDIEDNNGRFSIPLKQIRNDFLTTDDIELLDKQNSAGVKVELLDPCLDMTDMYLKKWKMGNIFVYNLLTGWKSVVRKIENGLFMGVEVQLWSFRSDNKLCFALVNLSNSVSVVSDDGVSALSNQTDQSSCISSSVGAGIDVVPLRLTTDSREDVWKSSCDHSSETHNCVSNDSSIFQIQ